MEQSNLHTGSEKMNNGINQKARNFGLLALALSGLLYLAVNDNNKSQSWAQQNTPMSTADSIAAAKADDETAASAATLLMTPH